jgi:LmbE family N-acetylglucosaminyl deacetylase
MRIVIETHADDAYLSLGALMKRWVKAGEAVRLVTVYSGTRKRAADAERWAGAMKLDQWTGCGLVEDDNGAGAGTVELPEDVATFLQRLCVGLEHLTYWPLGIGHPEHRGVGEAAPNCAFRYIDQPYARRTKWAPEVEERTRERIIEELVITHATDYRHHALFKDQARFMFYNKPKDLSGNVQAVLT